MDVVRRTYTAECRFIQGKPPGVIRWYWALPGARIYPTDTAFGSSAYDANRLPVNQGVGEVTGGLIAFVNGNLPPRQPGRQATGSPDVFRQGLAAPCGKHPIKPHPQPTRTQALDNIHGV